MDQPPLKTEVALDFPELGREAGDVEAVISVVAPRIAATTRVPLRLVAVLDKSGSMGGDKLRLLTQTMLFMLSKLSEGDALGLVAYGSEVNVLAPLTECTESGRRRLEAALNSLSAGTQTNLSGGLLAGLDLHLNCRGTGASAASTQMQQEKFEATDKQNTHFGVSAPPEGANPDGSVVRSTFLFTDGLANVGITQVGNLCRAAENKLGEFSGNRCTVSTFGFGADHNADLLKNLADIGAGVYSYVENEDQIGQAFGEALGGLLTTTHQNVKLSLELAPGVVVKKTCTDYAVEGPSAGSGGSSVLSITIGDLFAEERRDILIALTLPAAVHDGSEAVGQLHARGFSLLSVSTEETAGDEIRVERRGGAAATRSPRCCNKHVLLHKNRYIATEALQAARELAERNDLLGAQQRLKVAAEAIGNSPLHGDAACVRLVTDLEDCARDLQGRDTFMSHGSKKMAAMKMSHGTQRVCFGAEFSEAYANPSMKAMSASFKENVKK